MSNSNGLFVIVFLLSWNICFASNLIPILLALHYQGRGNSVFDNPAFNNPSFGYPPFDNRPFGYPPHSATSPTGIRDFEYVPTAQGYRYNYLQNDGYYNGDNVITNDVILPFDQYSGVDGTNTGLNAVGVGGRPKNRKLSPKTLQSLAG